MKFLNLFYLFKRFLKFRSSKSSPSINPPNEYDMVKNSLYMLAALFETQYDKQMRSFQYYCLMSNFFKQFFSLPVCICPREKVGEFLRSVLVFLGRDLRSVGQKIIFCPTELGAQFWFLELGPKYWDWTREIFVIGILPSLQSNSKSILCYATFWSEMSEASENFD